MKPPMIYTVYKVTMTRNRYGDFVASGTTTLKAHVRIITEAVTSVNNEQVQSDAMMWFEPDSGIEKEDVIKFKGEHYRVERLTEARRLRNPAVLFLKAELLKYGVIS